MKQIVPLLLIVLASACSYPGEVKVIHKEHYDIVRVTAYNTDQFVKYFDTLSIDKSKILFTLPDIDNSGEIEHYSIFVSK